MTIHTSIKSALFAACLVGCLSSCGGGGASSSDAGSGAADPAPVSWNVWDYLAFNGASVIASDSSLQLQYTFEEGAGSSVADSSGNNYSGSLIPFDVPTQLGTLWRGGHNGNGLLFSERGRVTIEQDLALDAALTGNTLAISCWFALSDTNLAGNYRLISKKADDFQTEGFELEINPSLRRVRFIGQAEEYIDGYIDVADMNTGWHHVMLNVNNGAGSIRLDGIDITDGSANTLINSSILQSVDPVSIGALSNGGTPATASFPGSLDDIRVYNRSLSITEQVQLFTDDQSQRGLIAWWQMDEESGLLLSDDSGFGHNATATDATVGSAGHTNNGVNFSLPSSRINAGGGFSLALTSQMSVASWVKVDDTDLNYYMRIVSKKELDSDTAGFEFAYYPEFNNLVFNGGGGKAAAASVILDTNWHHVAAAINGTQVQLYVDGVAVSTSGTIDTPLQSTRSVYLGHRATEDDTLPGTWLGDLDDVRIYAHQLTAAEVQSIYLESANNAPLATISNPAMELTVVKGATVELLGSATDTEDGNISATAEWTSSRDGVLGTGAFISTTSLSYGRHHISFTVTDADGAEASASVDVIVVSDPAASALPSIGMVNASSTWQTITTPINYVSPIVIATANYENSKSPAVVRVRNATGNTFELKVQNPSAVNVANYAVHYVVVEEGVYNLADHGIAMEALRFTSTRTDHDASWVGESISYANAYTNPVVVGQVASENDTNWSVFWSRGTSYANPVSASTAFIGKHVGEDSNTTRADEELHYLAIEASSGSFAGMSFHAGIGGDQVEGVDNNPAYIYAIDNVASASVGILSTTGVDGINGGWPILYAANPVSANEVHLAFDEDQIGDVERSHTAEQVAFFILADPGAPTLSLATPTARSVYASGDTVFFSASALDLEDGDLSAQIDWLSSIDGVIGTGASFDTSLLSAGFHVISAVVTDSDSKAARDSVEIVVMSVGGPVLDTGVAVNVSDVWQTISLSRTFTNIAVFCTVSSDDSVLPVVARVRNAAADSFELSVQNPSGSSVSGYTVHYQVYETGVYRDAEHGITMEILTLTSDKTDNTSNWSGTQRGYYNNYTSPVVLGQVMSADDARWSQFWSRGATQDVVASPSALFIGKHVGEDSDRERAPETVAYMIIEAGHGIIDGINYEAGVGSDTVLGVDDSPGYNYTLSNLVSAQAAIVSLSGIDGPNGGWPVLYGASPLSSTQLSLAIDEDQIGDVERSHTNEQLSYLVLAEFPVVYLGK